MIKGNVGKNDVANFRTQAIFYEYPNWEGYEDKYEPGEYPFAGKERRNYYRSLELPTGLVAEVYPYENFMGKSVLVTSSVKDFMKYGVEVGSFRIIVPNPIQVQMKNSSSYSQASTGFLPFATDTKTILKALAAAALVYAAVPGRFGHRYGAENADFVHSIMGGFAMVLVAHFLIGHSTCPC